MKKKKSPVVAVLLSAFAFPGLGQIYAKCYIKGLIFIVLSVVLFIAIAEPLTVGMLSFVSETSNLEAISSAAPFALPGMGRIKLYSILFSVVWVISTVDAWVCTKKMNERNAEMPDNNPA
jgi:hypothetical protein